MLPWETANNSYLLVGFEAVGCSPIQQKTRTSARLVDCWLHQQPGHLHWLLLAVAPCCQRSLLRSADCLSRGLHVRQQLLL